MRNIAIAALMGVLFMASALGLAADVQSGAGISKADATIIANRFFNEKIALEGIVAEPSQQGDNWVFPVKVGYRNVVGRDPILLNRFTGKASWVSLAEHDALRSGGKVPIAK